MNDREQAALETMVAFREARDTHSRGSKEWEELHRDFKKAEFEYYRARD
jgi:hypothetical protein